MLVNGKNLAKKILRRGKDLFQRAFIARSNDRNEFGKVQVIRRHPFRSASGDIAQAAGRCNIDLQRNDRAVPSEGHREEAPPMSAFLFGWRKLSESAKAVLQVFAQGMRASHVCDFYMTKYQSKAQQVLASAVGPLVAGLRRFETEAEGQHAQSDLQSYVRAKLRRIIFSANRSHWFSACELAIYVLTGGGHSIATHQDQPMFTNRTHYMMEECKRTLNGDATTHVLEASIETWNTHSLW